MNPTVLMEIHLTRIQEYDDAQLREISQCSTESWRRWGAARPQPLPYLLPIIDQHLLSYEGLPCFSSGGQSKEQQQGVPPAEISIRDAKAVQRAEERSRGTEEPGQTRASIFVQAVRRPAIRTPPAAAAT